jgi:predicted RNA binding protein YcfA (HicA-like mRNA interferase family)
VKPLTGKEFCRILEQHGWLLQRVHGSHHIYGREGSIVRLSVPVHNHHTLTPALENHLLKSAGLDAVAR